METGIKLVNSSNNTVSENLVIDNSINISFNEAFQTLNSLLSSAPNSSDKQACLSYFERIKLDLNPNEPEKTRSILGSFLANHAPWLVNVPMAIACIAQMLK